MQIGSAHSPLSLAVLKALGGDASGPAEVARQAVTTPPTDAGTGGSDDCSGPAPIDQVAPGQALPRGSFVDIKC